MDRPTQSADRGACAFPMNAGGASPPETNAEVHERLRTRFGIDSEFMRVGTLAKMLSMSANSIYVQMRRGVFPIEHRRAGTIVLVKVADFLDWHCSAATLGDAISRPQRRSPPAPPALSTPVALMHTERFEKTPIIRTKTLKQHAECIKQEVLAKMRAERAR